jgi:hypothetical protein
MGRCGSFMRLSSKSRIKEPLAISMTVLCWGVEDGHDLSFVGCWASA